MRLLGAFYPAFMLFDVVDPRNTFWFDAAAGAAVVVAGWWIARTLVSSSDAAAPVRSPRRGFVDAPAQ